MTYDFRKFVEKIEKTTINIKNNAIKVMNTLEDVISNDVTKNKEISLFLRLKLRRQNAIVEKNQFSLKCDNYWKNCQNSQCRQHQESWRQWLNTQRQHRNTRDEQERSSEKIERRKTLITIRINNFSLIKQRKGKASQWKIHWRNATIRREPYNN